MQINFQNIKAGHLNLLHRWFMQPYIAYWWPEPSDFASFYIQWSQRINTGLSAYHTPWSGHLITVEKRPIGYIHHYRVKQDRYAEYLPFPPHAVSIDFFIGEPEYLGKKMSVPILHRYIDTIIKKDNPQSTTLIIDPDITNTRAIHAYAKAGFKPIGSQTQSHHTLLLMYKHI